VPDTELLRFRSRGAALAATPADDPLLRPGAPAAT
jgi:hypothetical protein